MLHLVYFKTTHDTEKEIFDEKSKSVVAVKFNCAAESLEEFMKTVKNEIPRTLNSDKADDIKRALKVGQDIWAVLQAILPVLDQFASVSSITMQTLYNHRSYIRRTQY